MKTIFMPAKSDVDVIPTVKKALKHLPEKVGLLCTIQHIDKLNEAKEFLEKNGRKVFVAGQILGCNITKADKIVDQVDAFLYVGSGNFHPVGAILKTRKKIVCANPFREDVSVIDEKELDRLEKKKKGAYLKFLSSDNIGVIVSVKPGQNAFRSAEKLKAKYKDKKFYFFVTDTINYGELENFPFIECWVNTACPRIDEDYELINKPIVNLNEL